MKEIVGVIKRFLLFGVGIPVLATIPVMLGSLFGGFVFVQASPWMILIFLALFYYLWRKKITPSVVVINFIWTIIALAAFCIFVILGNGGVETSVMLHMLWVLFPYFLSNSILMLYGNFLYGLFGSFVGLLTGLVLSLILQKEHGFGKKSIRIGSGILILLVILCGAFYCNRSEKKYAGHGFAYMNGYSSTDFSEYHVYSQPSKLVTLDHKTELQIEADYPVMDGAEACYPLYAAIAKNLYSKIGEIEEDVWSGKEDEKYRSTNGKYVSFTNSVSGYERLLYGEVDLFFGSRPSKAQLEEAREQGVELEVLPIGKEGFVFFVEEDNPLDSISSDDLKKIYHGDVTNWKEVGGKNQKIIPFQRPANSGSQTMMEYFMDDVSLKEPLTYEKVSSMEGVIREVAQYTNRKGALGYTFRYFLEGLHQEQGVKMLSIDGIYPTRENIEDGTYPLTTNLCLITRKDNKKETVKRVIDFILSEDGQKLVEETGYSRLNIEK